MRMPQVRRQFGKFPLDVDPSTIPVNEDAGGEPMPHVMQPGTVAVAATWRAKADLARNLGKIVSRGPVGHTTAVFREEEGRCGRPANNPFPLSRVIDEDSTGRVMQGDESRLAELRPPNGDDPLLQIHVLSIEGHRLA